MLIFSRFIQFQQKSEKMSRQSFCERGKKMNEKELHRRFGFWTSKWYIPGVSRIFFSRAKYEDSLFCEIIIKIDSIIWSFCLCHACKMVYLIWARKLNQHCVKSDAKQRSGVRDPKQNKHQLLHRIASVWTSPIYNIITEHNIAMG